MVVTIHDIIQKAKNYKPEINEERIVLAYSFMEKAHAGQTRFSGEPFIVHPLNVADILLEFHCDENTLIAALLHDVAEDTERTLEDIEKLFGKEVKDLCSGMVKLSKIRPKLNDPQIENLRKLFWAMIKDFRVVLIKLCDRLHNMHTLNFVRPEKQTRIAQETLNIYVPIAARLGIYRVKSQLEDLCFEYLYPDDFKNIQDQLVKSGKWREKYIESAKKNLKENLFREGVQADIDGRVKSAYSIYRKLKRKNKNTIQDIFDVFAMRIILPDIYKYEKEYVGHLYTVLGLIHNHFTPLANRFKDYIAVPKVNGYRSLHTTVMGLGLKGHTQPTEVQIRSETMHQNAEFGIAAHWFYEEGFEFAADDFKEVAVSRSHEAAAASSFIPFLKNHRKWISGLGEMEQEIKGNQDFFENLRSDMLQDRIFILTPHGDVKDLPIDATPIDFAYAVHTEVGNTCIGAKVNGNMVPLDYELKSGEVVEIVTRKNSKPAYQWLSFVKTNHARNRIRGWFRDLDVDKHLRAGKELLNEKLCQLGKPPLDEKLSMLRNYESKRLTFKEREELLIEIGKGFILPSTIVRKIFTLAELLGNADTLPAAAEPSKSIEDKEKQKEKNLYIGGEKNMPYHFVKCCSADLSERNGMQADEFIGYVTRGRGVSVHKKGCKTLSNIEAGRIVPVGSSSASKSYYPVRVVVEVDDRVGLIRDISQVIVENSINIMDMTYQEKGSDGNGPPIIKMLLEICHFDQLERVLSKVAKIPNVRRAFKTN